MLVAVDERTALPGADQQVVGLACMLARVLVRRVAAADVAAGQADAQHRPDSAFPAALRPRLGGFLQGLEVLHSSPRRISGSLWLGGTI